MTFKPSRWLATFRIDQRLIAAAREDNEDLFQDVLEEGDVDINYQDG